MAIRPGPTPKPDYSDAGVARERRPVTRESIYDDVDRSGALADFQDATEVQTLIDASVADFPTDAEAEAIAEGVVTDLGLGECATLDVDDIYGDYWTDLVFPAVAINPLGTAAPPTLNNSTGLLEFSATVDNTVIFTWQLPHGWSGEYDITKAVVVPHLHVRHLTSTSAPTNVSRWKFEYDVADANGNFVNAYGTFTTLTTVNSTNPASTTKCSIVSFGDLDLANYGASTILHCKVSRLANSDGADTDTSVIALLNADLHYQVRRSGTAAQIPT